MNEMKEHINFLSAYAIKALLPDVLLTYPSLANIENPTFTLKDKFNILKHTLVDDNDRYRNRFRDTEDTVMLFHIFFALESYLADYSTGYTHTHLHLAAAKAAFTSNNPLLAILASSSTISFSDAKLLTQTI